MWNMNDTNIVIALVAFGCLVSVGSILCFIPFVFISKQFLLFVFSIEDTMADLRRIYKDM